MNLFFLCRSNCSLLPISHLAMVHSQVLCHRVGVGGPAPFQQHLPWLQLCCEQGKDLSSSPLQAWPLLGMEAAVQHFSGWTEESTASFASLLLLFKICAVFSI